MQRAKYALEFKDEAAKQVVARGHSLDDAGAKLEACAKPIYHPAWGKGAS